MRRRDFITLIGGAAVWPFAARAQQPERVRRIGVLMSLAADDRGRRQGAFFSESPRDAIWWTATWRNQTNPARCVATG
jgi:hypothetical protein